MTEETRAPGPEMNVDILHIAPGSKKADRDYQWFAVTIMGCENQDAHLRAVGGGWQPVSRAAMPSEASFSADLIERKGMRLYERPAEVSEKIRDEHLRWARRGMEAVGSHELGQEILAVADPYIDAWKRFHELHSRIESHPRGSLLVLHEATMPARFRPVLARFWQALLLFRVVYLSRDESELADRQRTSYAEWGWCKKDLVRERLLPTRLPRFKFVVKTFAIKLPKLPPIPWRRWRDKLRRR